jgi:hypothetical protein
LKRSTLLSAKALGCVLLCSLSASAATITAFTASYTANPEYSFSSLQTKFSGSTALVTNTSLTCLSEISCSGQILTFSIQGTGLDPTQLLAVSLDGNLSGTSSGTGSLAISASGIPVANQAYSFKAGDFSGPLLSTFTPITGNFAFTGVLSLNLLSGQTLTLPSSLAISVGSPAAAPEPGSLVLLATGFSGLLVLIRHGRTRRSN